MVCNCVLVSLLVYSALGMFKFKLLGLWAVSVLGCICVCVGFVLICLGMFAVFGYIGIYLDTIAMVG